MEQAMTSFPIPGGVLISSLQDSMLYLTRREKIHGDRKSLSARSGQEPCSMSTDESDSMIGEENLLKKQKVRILDPWLMEQMNWNAWLMEQMQ
ncbi:hypothetical protein K1719_008595 [Acacia pycnantha]|nr:hypothetical protein K1719_008595 [Acacia pycnantha]